MNMNEDQHHDLERGKLRASLNWLIAKAFCDKIPSVYSDLFLEDAKGLWYLKPQVIRALTTGELYCAACTHLFADKDSAWTDHALVLSHLWQRRGVRAVEKNGQPVVEAALKRDSPFYSAAHIGLVDAIMRAYMAQAVDLPSVMRDIGRFYPFPGPSVPPSLEEGLELWLACVSETVLERRVPLRDPNERQTKVRLLLDGMRFATRLACLLRFYCERQEASADLAPPLQDLSAVEAHADLGIAYCRRLRELAGPRTPSVLHLDRRQLAHASLSSGAGLGFRVNCLCLLAELFVILPCLLSADRAVSPRQQQQQQASEMPNFHLSKRINTRVNSPGRGSGVFRLRDDRTADSASGSASDEGGGVSAERRRRSRGNSLTRSPPDRQEQQLGALFSSSQRRTSSPRPTAFTEALMPAALKPSKERLTPEVSKAVESGEAPSNGPSAPSAVSEPVPAGVGFRARTDPRSPISAGTYRLPKSQSRDRMAALGAGGDARRRSGGSDDEFMTPSEDAPRPLIPPGPSSEDGRVTFAQFLSLQRQQKEAEETAVASSAKSASAHNLHTEPLPGGDAMPQRSLKEEFERKRKERQGRAMSTDTGGSAPAPKRTTFAPLPNQTTWAAQQKRRQSETGSVDGGERSGGESERGSSSSLHLLPSFTDTKIRIEQKKRQIKADLKRADAKLRQMREEENKRIFQQLCMQKSGRKNGELEEKEIAVEKDKAKEKKEEHQEKTKKRVESADDTVMTSSQQEAQQGELEQPSTEVVRLQSEVESMRKEKESLKELLMQLQRQQDMFQQQQQQQLEEIQQRHLEQQQQMLQKQQQQEEQLKQQRLLQQQQQLEQERERQRLQHHAELEQERERQQQQLQLMQQQQELDRQRIQFQLMQQQQQLQQQAMPVQTPLETMSIGPASAIGGVSSGGSSGQAAGPARSSSPVPSDGGLSVGSGSQTEYNSLYDRFNQSLTELQQDISKLSLQQEFMNQTIKERLQESNAATPATSQSAPQPTTAEVANAGWAAQPPTGPPMYVYGGVPFNGTAQQLQPAPPLPSAEPSHSVANDSQLTGLATVSFPSSATASAIATTAATATTTTPTTITNTTPASAVESRNNTAPAALPLEAEAPPASTEETSPAAFFVSFGEEGGAQKQGTDKSRRPVNDRQHRTGAGSSSSTTSTESTPSRGRPERTSARNAARSKSSTPAAASKSAPTSAPAPAPVPAALVSAVPPGTSFVLNELDMKGLSDDEVSRRRERFMAQQAKRLAEREAERQEKEVERERDRIARLMEKEAQEAKRAREREKRDRVFQSYLERKAKEEEEESPHRRSGPSRASRAPISHSPSTHSPAATPVMGTPTRNRSAGPTLTGASSSHHPRRGAASAHAHHITPSPLALDLPPDKCEPSSPLYEYQGIGSTTVRLSAAASRPHINSRDSSSTPVPEYSGPRLFKQPKERSNRSVIANAINHCLLPGVVNKDVRNQVVEELSKAEGTTFMILFRNRSCQYRGLYIFHQDAEDLTRFTGSGPKKVRNSDVVDFFKYDSGAKKFSLIDTTKHLSPVVDAFTIDNKLWKKSGTRPSGQVSAVAPSAPHGSGYATRRQ